MPLRNHSAVSTKSYQQTNQGNRPRNFVLKANALAQFWQPAWGGKNTTIRILPAPDPDNPGKFLPTRVDDPTGTTDAPVFSPWIARYWAIRRFGDPKIVMLVAGDDQEPNDVLSQSPGSILLRAVRRAIDRRQDRTGWASLVNGTNAVLTPTKPCCLVQCFLFRWNSKSYINIPGRQGLQPPRGARSDDQVVVMMLPPSAANALMRIMDDGKAAWENDPVSIAPGAFVHIFERGADVLRGNVNADDMYNSKPVDASAGGADDKFKGYDIRLTATLDGDPKDPPASLAGREALVASKVRPWDELVHMRSYEEQLRVICRAFLSCPDRGLRDILVDVTKYAFDEERASLPEEILNYGKTTVAVSTPKKPAAPPAQAPVAPVVPADNLYSAPVVSTADEEVPEDATGGDPVDDLPPIEEPPAGPPTDAEVLAAMEEAKAKARQRVAARQKNT